jgi:hypothetical protein
VRFVQPGNGENLQLCGGKGDDYLYVGKADWRLCSAVQRALFAAPETPEADLSVCPTLQSR